MCLIHRYALKIPFHFGPLTQSALTASYEICHFTVHKLCHILNLLAGTKSWLHWENSFLSDACIHLSTHQCFSVLGKGAELEWYRVSVSISWLPTAASRPSILIITAPNTLLTATTHNNARLQSWAKTPHIINNHVKIIISMRKGELGLEFDFFLWRKLRLKCTAIREELQT